MLDYSDRSPRFGKRGLNRRIVLCSWFGSRVWKRDRWSRKDERFYDRHLHHAGDVRDACDRACTGSGRTWRWPERGETADTNEVETLPVVDDNNLDIKSDGRSLEPLAIESIGDESLVDAIPTAEETTAIDVAPTGLKDFDHSEELDLALPADEAVIEPAETVVEELNQSAINVAPTTDETTERESLDVTPDNRQPEKADEI